MCLDLNYLKVCFSFRTYFNPNHYRQSLNYSYCSCRITLAGTSVNICSTICKTKSWPIGEKYFDNIASLWVAPRAVWRLFAVRIQSCNNYYERIKIDLYFGCFLLRPCPMRILYRLISLYDPANIGELLLNFERSDKSLYLHFVF